ncbi:MAG: hypothetical protein NZ822_02275 [Patescibacteria group bacterium]|nr:hypothetical protein [Patescibacteria group bacterium]
MLNNTLEANSLKKILEMKVEIEDVLSLKNIPPEELKTYLGAIKIIEEIFNKIDYKTIQSLDKNDLKRWSLVFIFVHDIFHGINNLSNYTLAKTEINSTLPAFQLLKNLVGINDYQKFIYAYFSLSASSLKINHQLENLISEKIILGEFHSIGGFDITRWGIKLKEDLFDYALQSINKKFENDKYSSLIKRYSNFSLDFIY